MCVSSLTFSKVIVKRKTSCEIELDSIGTVVPTCDQMSPTALHVNELGQHCCTAQLFLIKAAVSPGVLEVKG